MAYTLSVILAFPLVAISLPSNANTSVGVCDASITGDWGGGSGTQSDPYLVCSRSQLENLGAAGAGEYVKLAKSIDLGGSDSPWTPISSFTGNLDGDFHTISGMYVTGNRDKYGFFEQLNSGSSVKNIQFGSPEIVSQYTSATQQNSVPDAGVIAGVGTAASMENIYVTSPNFSGPIFQAGGVIGEGSTSSPPQLKQIHVSNISINASQPGSEDPQYGGAVGGGAASMHRVFASGSIQGVPSGGAYGGALGSHRNADLSLTQITTNVTINNVSGGGFSDVGGVIGIEGTGSTNLEDIFVIGGTGAEPFTSGNVGGVAGAHFHTMSRILMVGAVGSPGATRLGPIEGFTSDNASPSDVLYDQDVNPSLSDTAEYGTGKTTAELETISTFSDFNIVTDIPADWSLDDPTAPIWKITEGSYPEQIWVDVSAARFNTTTTTETKDIYVYPGEQDTVLRLADLGVDTVAIDKLGSSLLDISNFPSSRISLVSQLTADTSFDVYYRDGLQEKKVTYTVKTSDEDLNPAITTFDATPTVAVGDTVWATAYERYLDTNVLVDGLEANRVDEYVYRITTAENDSTALADLQSIDGYQKLEIDQQNQWYEDEGFGTDGVNYNFSWYAFVCVGSTPDDIQPATNIKTEYTTLESIMTDAGLDSELNADLRGLLHDWARSTEPERTVVGEGNQNILGYWYSNNVAFGSLLVTGDCESGYSYQALPIISNSSALADKSFTLSDTLELSSNRQNVEVSSVGHTIGVTGVGPLFDMALWGLATIGEATKSSGFSSPSPFAGPVITDVGLDNKTGPFETSPEGEVRVRGTNLDGLTSVRVDGQEVEFNSIDDDNFSFVMPEGIVGGLYDLDVTVDGVSISVQSTLQVLSVGDAASICDGQSPTLWTKAVSPTQAKAYIKCGTPGVSYKVQVQTDGVGEYETVITRTLEDIYDDRQVFNGVGRYIVRTLDLQDVTRIRILADDEREWQVRYNAGSFGG